MVNEQVTTVNLTEGEIATVEFASAYPFYWITNMSDGDIYVSLNAPEAYSDGTYTITAGERHRISGGVSDKKINLLGNGRVQIEACAIAALPSFKKRASGAHTDDDVTVCNFPLTADLNDVSGHGAQLTYSGDTELTFAEDGVYLYYGRLGLSADLLNGANRFTVEFDVKINSSGTSKYPYYRRTVTAIGTKILFCEVDYTGSTTNNKFRLAESGSSSTSSTSNAYADGNYHHMVMTWDLLARVVVIAVDDIEYAPIIISAGYTAPSLLFGDATYGLNGYIKNIKITKRKEE